MPSVSTADRTGPDLATTPLYGVKNASPIYPLLICPPNGYVEFEVPYAGTKRVLVEWPQHPATLDDTHLVYATLIWADLTAHGIIILPSQIGYWAGGLDQAYTAGVNPGTFDPEYFKPGTRLYYQIEVPDADNLNVYVFLEDGTKVYEMELNHTGLFVADPVVFAVGWPTQKVYEVAHDYNVQENRVMYETQILAIEDGNKAATNIALDPANLLASLTYEGSKVGTLVATHATETGGIAFELVAGTGDTDNASFTIFGKELRAASTIAAGAKSIRVTATDRFGYEFTEPVTFTIV